MTGLDTTFLVQVEVQEAESRGSGRASQGAVNEARDNLREALALFFETASAIEIERWLHEVYVTRGRGRGWVDWECVRKGARR